MIEGLEVRFKVPYHYRPTAIQNVIHLETHVAGRPRIFRNIILGLTVINTESN